MLEKINMMYEKDNEMAYRQLLALEIICCDSNELYDYFEYFLKMLDSDKSCIRTRGFRLICALSKWDLDNKIDNNIDKILNNLDNEVSTSLRQCLNSLMNIVLYKENLNEKIIHKLSKLNITKYKETMQFLIKKDIEKIIKSIK